MRPIYEREEDVKQELEIMNNLKDKWKFEYNKLPIKYTLDYVMYRDRKAMAFCEIKCRNMTTQTNENYGGFLIALNKWVAAKNLCDATGLPFILIFRLTDGDYYSSITDFSIHKGVFCYPPRNDRGDWQDQEPGVRLDVNMFKKI
jgi:hypothetical protein